MAYTKPFFIVINPIGSKFARALQHGLKEKVTNKVFRRTTPKQGRSYFAVTAPTLNKIQQLQRFKEHNVSCPKFATSLDELKSLDARTVFARKLINGTNGRGIVEFNPGDGGDPPRAPLYTEYVPKKSEYRFHVFGGKVIDVQEKRKRRGFEAERNTRIRNVNNGYVYCRDGVSPPDGAADLAIRAVAACGYQYGAVDLIYNEKRGQCYVLEVNSRPGLMGTTLDKYIDAMIDTFNLRRK